MAQSAIQPLDPIPVYVGDDWSLRFSYRETKGNQPPVDLTGAVVAGTFYPPFLPVGIELTPESNLAEVVAPVEGLFDLRLDRGRTIEFTPSEKGGALHIRLIKDGLLRTVGVWPLLVLGPREPIRQPIVNRALVDPVTGWTLTFDGWGAAPPAVIGTTADFSDPENAVLVPGLTG